jgi:hypothetical protein
MTQRRHPANDNRCFVPRFAMLAIEPLAGRVLGVIARVRFRLLLAGI